MKVIVRGTSRYVYVYTDTNVIEFKQYKDDCSLEDTIRKLLESLGHEIVKE